MSREALDIALAAPEWLLRGAAFTAAVALATLGAFPAAAEQREPKGAEQRYEVTIAPPHRPGSETPQAIAPDNETGLAQPDRGSNSNSDAAQDTSAADEAPSLSDPAASPPPTGQPESSRNAAGPTQAAPATAAKAEGPRLTLQVGAYRLKRSAEKLRDTLAATFRDVTILDTTSGGEPLYRVRVGKLPKGPALEDIKRRLLAAGYPAFEVAAAEPQDR